MLYSSGTGFCTFHKGNNMIQTFYICFILLFTGDVLTAEAESDHLHNTPDAHGHSSKLHDSEFVTNEEHMKTHHEHEFGEEDDISKLSLEEQEFRFFYAHDYNNDTSLDGLEIFQAITHGMTEENWVEWEKAEKAKDEGADLDREGLVMRLVDEILGDDDLDNNGLITYEEFNVRRRREANAEANSAKT